MSQYSAKTRQTIEEDRSQRDGSRKYERKSKEEKSRTKERWIEHGNMKRYRDNNREWTRNSTRNRKNIASWRRVTTLQRKEQKIRKSKRDKQKEKKQEMNIVHITEYDIHKEGEEYLDPYRCIIDKRCPRTVTG